MQCKILKTKHKLHSIPINKVKNNVLYSVPCVSVLLLVGSMMVCSVFLSNNAFAEASTETRDTSTASLILSNSNMKSDIVPGGGIATVSTEVTVDVKNAESYSLTISFDNTTLTNGNTTISAGNAVDDNTWGYRWDLADAYTAPTIASNELATPVLVNGSANFTKVLTFAAKFDANADPGTYHASGNLRLVATPKKTVSLEEITDMQEMTAEICNNATVGDSKELVDTRDDAKYVIQKFADEGCWMTTDLTIIDKTITPSDSNVTSDFTIPATSTTGFSAMSSTDGYAAKVYGSGTARKYYNWYTATAGAGDASMNSGVARTSICPKGWRLPTGAEGGEFEVLYKAVGSPSSSNFAKAPYNFSSIRYVQNGSTLDTGMSTGYWWSSVVYDSERAYALGYSMIAPSLTTIDNRYYGFAIRCIADNETAATPTTYALDFNIDGGSGGPAAQTAISFSDNYTFTIPTASPTKTGNYEFVGWNEEHNIYNCPSVKYKSGDKITLQSDSPSITLYAAYKSTMVCM